MTPNEPMPHIGKPGSTGSTRFALIPGLVAFVGCLGCGGSGPSIWPPPPPPPSPNAKLNGQYAFLFNGMDDVTGQQVAIAGSFKADGAGSIVNGIHDVSGPNASPLCNAACPQLRVPITGTYSIGNDNRGTLNIKSSIGTTKYAIAVGSLDSSGVANKARFIEFDDTTDTVGTRGSGVMFLQDVTAFSQSKFTGPYAFGISGQDSSTRRIATVGRFNADGMGNVTSGTEAINDSGTLFTGGVSGGSFSGSYTAPDTNGRLTNMLSSATAPPSTLFPTSFRRASPF